MCGICGIVGDGLNRERLDAMVASLRHRGPDDAGTRVEAFPAVGLGHRRLSILDLSAAGHQPMANRDGSCWLVLNGEIYNYRELKRGALADYPYRSQTDTEVVLAAYERWGERCVDHLLGMFAFAIWDQQERKLVCARDRFGVKPFYYSALADGALAFASEIKALHAGGVPVAPDDHTWRQYLVYGLQDHSARSFFGAIQSLPAGCVLTWQAGQHRVSRWYDLPARVLDRYPDARPESVVSDEYLALLEESIDLRFRSDVPVGICLSGGLDSSLLLALVHRVQGSDSAVRAFTFTCGDAAYDETPWVRDMLQETRHPWQNCELTAADVPKLAEEVAAAEDEPFGGIPSLAYSNVFRRAREAGVVVLLDGQGMDEQWAGYDYYLNLADHAERPAALQGSKARTARPDLLRPAFCEGGSADELPRWSGEPLLDRRLRDILHTKIPRALRFNDRISMMHSCELREPFLDHRLVELALIQPPARLIQDGQGKVFLRKLATVLLPEGIRLAPKRPVQTPQREWLAHTLAPWVRATVEGSCLYREWYRPGAIAVALDELKSGATDNSYAVWQMLSLALWETATAGNPA